MKRYFLTAVGLALVLVVMATPLPAAARAVWTEFSGTETLQNIVYPGDWVWLPSGNVHVRGRVTECLDEASDARVSGVDTIVVNANWDSAFTGPMWGTFHNEVAPGPDCKGGGVWEGTWTGMVGTEGCSWRAVGQGVSGCVEGLHVSYVANCGVDPTTFTGTILDSHD
jgi:hypothetical protein